MFGKLMNRYFYGKSGQGDFEKEDLPQNRWQLFWEMLRVRFSALLRLNLMYVVVWIPAIFFIGRFLMYGYSGLVNLSDFQAQLEAGSITACSTLRPKPTSPFIMAFSTEMTLKPSRPAMPVMT